MVNIVLNAVMGLMMSLWIIIIVLWVIRPSE